VKVESTFNVVVPFFKDGHSYTDTANKTRDTKPDHLDRLEWNSKRRTSREKRRRWQACPTFHQVSEFNQPQLDFHNLAQF
jgi:hypothetical protein